jgi:drug/metabolite transporter (DMT)-like permease
MPAPRHILLMLLAGALMVGGHICIFIAYKVGPARSVAPFMYTLTLWAVLAGAILFNDIPNALAIAGMALVLLAGLLVIYADAQHRPKLNHAEPMAQDDRPYQQSTPDQVR